MLVSPTRNFGVYSDDNEKRNTSPLPRFHQTYLALYFSVFFSACGQIGVDNLSVDASADTDDDTALVGTVTDISQNTEGETDFPVVDTETDSPTDTYPSDNTQTATIPTIPTDTAILPDSMPSDWDDATESELSSETETGYSTLIDASLADDTATETEWRIPTDTENWADSVTEEDSDSVDGTDTIVETDTGGTSSSTDTAMQTDTLIVTDTGAATDTAVVTDTSIPTDTLVSTDTLIPTDTAIATDTELDECVSLYSGALECTGFEDGEALDKQSVFRGSVDVVNDQAFTGEYALRSWVEGNGNYATSNGSFSPLFEGESIFFRAYYYIPAGQMTGLFKIAAFEGAINSFTEDLNIDFLIIDGNSLNVHLHEQPEGSDDFFASAAVPSDRWFCLQGGVYISDTEGTVTFSMDGAPGVDISGVDTLNDEGVSYADFGIGWTEDMDNDIEIFVDNVVVDTAPVPCH